MDNQAAEVQWCGIILVIGLKIIQQHYFPSLKSILNKVSFSFLPFLFTNLFHVSKGP